MPYAVQVEGIQALKRSFRRLESDLPVRLRERLVGLADIVAQEGRRQAEAEGLHETGALIAGIVPSVRGMSAIVRDRAMRRRGKNAPYPYPRLYEYVKGRPFLGPALDAKRDEIIAGLDQMLDELGGEAGFF